MPTKVTVALVGTPPQLPSSVTEEEWNRPWADRRKATLEVEDDEKLSSLIDRAARELGIPKATSQELGAALREAHARTE